MRVRYGTRVITSGPLQAGVYAGVCWEAVKWLHAEDMAAQMATLAEVVERGRTLASPPEIDEAEPPVRVAREVRARLLERRARKAELEKEEGER